MSKTSIKDLQDLKERAERMRRESDRAQGALEQTKTQMKDEFKVGSVEEAEKLLKTLEEEETTAKAAFDTKMEEFEDEWGDKL